jgi:hypothetical protein
MANAGTAGDAHTDQTGHVIERTDEGLPCYFSAIAGRDAGAGGAGWIAERDKALRFARPIDAKHFYDTYLIALAPYCRAVPVKP